MITKNIKLASIKFRMEFPSRAAFSRKHFHLIRSSIHGWHESRFIFCSVYLLFILCDWLDGFWTFLWPHWFPPRGDVQIFYRILIFKHLSSRSSSVQINATHPPDQQTIQMQWFQIKIHQAKYFVTANHHHLDASILRSLQLQFPNNISVLLHKVHMQRWS